jgi:CheY-like chemotaxis protein
MTELSAGPGRSLGGMLPLARPERPIRVLVIDDDLHMLALYEHALASWAAPELVASAEQALAIIQGGAIFDVVLCDLEMDGMSGRALLKELQFEYPIHASRMVIVSGTAASDADANFLRALGDRWLQKPVKPFVLQSIVQTIGRIRAA